MRRWTPQPPCPRIREKLFGTAAPTATTAPGGGLRWLAPALAALALSLIVGVDRPGSLSALSRAATNGLRWDGRAGAAWAAYQSAPAHSFHNNLAGPKLEWTNKAAWTSALPPLPLRRTNDLLP